MGQSVHKNSNKKKYKGRGVSQLKKVLGRKREIFHTKNRGGVCQVSLADVFSARGIWKLKLLHPNLAYNKNEMSIKYGKMSVGSKIRKDETDF